MTSVPTPARVHEPANAEAGRPISVHYPVKVQVTEAILRSAEHETVEVVK